MVRDDQLCYGWSVMISDGQLLLWIISYGYGQLCYG